MRQFFFSVCALCAVSLAFCFDARTSSAGILKLGVMGDSLSDEYFQASYGSYAKNWTVLFDQRGIDLGPTAAEAGAPGGTWGAPRHTGYEYNWALAGATTTTLLSGGQHTGLAGHVASKGLSHAVLLIGANDFAPGSTAYSSIYNGSWSAAQIESYVASRVANVTTAVDTVLPTGVKLLVGNFPDYAVAPATKSAYPNAVQRDRVTTVIAEVNSRLLDLAVDRDLPLLDIFGVSKAIFGTNTVPNATLEIGDVPIDLNALNNFGSNPQAAFNHDGVHIMTTLQALLGNLILEGFNLGYGAGESLWSESQVLALAGLAYGGSDTVEAQIGPYSNYVLNLPAPELVGDANGDCTVGAADYAIWAAQFGQTGATLSADFDASGSVGTGDYALWAANFGNTCATGAKNVPEPSALALCLLGLALLAAAQGAEAMCHAIPTHD